MRVESRVALDQLEGEGEEKEERKEAMSIYGLDSEGHRESLVVIYQIL